MTVKKTLCIVTYLAIIVGAAYKIYRKVTVKEKPKKESRQKPLYGLKESCDRAAKSDRMLDLAVSDALYNPIPRVVYPKTQLGTGWGQQLLHFLDAEAKPDARGGIPAAIDRALESHYAARR